jgi:hypothetical protein
MGSLKYKWIRKLPTGGTASRQKIILVQRPSVWDRAISIMNLFISSTLAAAALWLGYSYNANEQANRDRENAREERRDAIAARIQMETAISRCIQYNIDLSRQREFDRDPMYRLALTRQIADFSVNCRRIGQPLENQIVQGVLRRFASLGDQTVRQAARDALATIRQEQSKPPPSLHERAAAFRALGGHLHYVTRVGNHLFYRWQEDAPSSVVSDPTTEPDDSVRLTDRFFYPGHVHVPRLEGEPAADANTSEGSQPRN